jgi:ATP-dependent Clp protease adaptor protein ClpS
MCQVVLHNDDKNTVSHVIHCLQLVFAYDIAMAAKIMLEAHEKGRAIAEVEAETPAIEHRDQLRSYGLSATVEPI